MNSSPKSLDQKLAVLASGRNREAPFILADAKDADMAFGIAAPGFRAPGQGQVGSYRSLGEYRDSIRAIVEEALVDIMLLSASNLERLAIEEGIFAKSSVTPAARANDTTDIWLVRGGAYGAQLSRPFRSASLDHIQYGRRRLPGEDLALKGADLGLYSITFTNSLEQDLRALEAYAAFREEAEAKGFRHFLELFNPPSGAGLSLEGVAGFLNDHIVRTLAGLTRRQRPLFLKMPYNGPRALEELVAYDPELIVGILGGAAGTSRDAFQLLHDARSHGARVALFGRKINQAEDPLAFLRLLRRVADAEMTPVEAVRAYHAELKKAGKVPWRGLDDDLRITQAHLDNR